MNAMSKIIPGNPLTALVYGENIDIGASFAELARKAREAGLRLGGVVEIAVAPATPARRCDVDLQDLATGQRIRIYEERGALARGCRLDLDGLGRSCALVLSSLPHCDLILLNKFGKAETEGGGFRCIISDALAAAIPVVIGVPRRNLAAWRAFAGELAVEREIGEAFDFRAAASLDC